MALSVPAGAISRDEDPWGIPAAELMAQEEAPPEEPEEPDEPEPDEPDDPDPEEDPDEPDPDDPAPESEDDDLASRFSACLASCLSAPEDAERSISRLRLAVP